MMRLNAILGASALIVAIALPGWAQQEATRTMPTHTVTLKGTVETIDHAKYVMNIKTSDGKFETIDVPKGAKRFDELKVGDKVSVTYNNNVSARVKPPGEAAVDTAATASTMGQEARPGGTAVVQRTMTATVSRHRQERLVDHLRRSQRTRSTAGASSIRRCSTWSRSATRSTSPGTPTSW